MKKNGFTLAEVLLTLVIVGIVAALTIPALLSSTGNQEAITALKKAYRTIDSATSRIRQENYSTFKGVLTSWSSNEMLNVYKNYMTYSKICYENTPGCFPTGIKDITGADYAGPYISNSATLQGADGICYSFEVNSYNCDFWTLKENGQDAGCGSIYIDTNCLKPPNKIGRDIFVIRLGATTIRFSGGIDTVDEGANCDPSNSYGGWGGNGCGGRVVKDGWQIKY